MLAHDLINRHYQVSDPGPQGPFVLIDINSFYCHIDQHLSTFGLIEHSVSKEWRT